MWLDRDRTAEEVARFSTADAAAYLRLLDEYDQVKSIFSRSQFTPVGFGPSLDAMLAEHPRGRIWARRRQLSAVGWSRHEFTSRHIQAFLLWMAFQVVPAGGYARLGRAPLRADLRPPAAQLVDPGRRVRAADRGPDRVPGRSRRHRAVRPAGHPAAAGRAAAAPGCETEDGEQYRAGTAVVSTIHVKHLRDMAPARRLAGGVPLRRGHLRRRRARLRHLLLATSAPPEFAAPRRPAQTAVSAGPRGLAGGHDPAGRGPAGGPVHRGRRPGCWWPRRPWPTRAGRRPASTRSSCSARRSTSCPPGWAAGTRSRSEHARRQLERLRQAAPSFTDEVILGQLVKSPADYRAAQPAHDPRRVPRRGPRPGVQPGRCARRRAGPRTGCRSRACTRPAAPPIPAVPSPARPAVTRPSCCCTTSATTRPR